MLECPFEKDGVLEGIRKLTKEDGLMVEAITEVKCSNVLAKHNNRLLKAVAWLFVLAVIILLGVGVLAWVIFSDVRIVEVNMGKSITKQDQLVEDVRELVQSQKDTKEAVDEVKKDQDEKPTIELVPEEDPEKAKEAPVKLKYTPGKKPKKGDDPHPPAPSQTAVEVPLPVKDAKVVPDKKLE